MSSLPTTLMAYDPSFEGRPIHTLRNIIVIVLCAAISGANDFVAIEKLG